MKAEIDDVLPEVMNGRTQWSNVGLDLGYRYYRSDRWELAARLRRLSADLQSGSGDDQETLNTNFTAEIANSFSYQLGRPLLHEIGSARRSGFRAMGMLSYTPQRWLGDLRGGVLSASVGVQMTFYGWGYQER